MNIAFQTVVILAIALPGIIFRQRCSIAGRFRRREPWPEEVAESVLAAGISHAIWIPVANIAGWWWSVRVDLRAALTLVSGVYGTEQHDGLTAINAVVDHPLAVFLYFVSLYFAASTAGMLWRKYREACGGKCWAPIAIRRLIYDCGKVDWQSALKEWCIGGDAGSHLIEQYASEPGARRYAQWRGILRVGENPEGQKCLETLVAATVVIGSTPYLYLGLLGHVEWNEQTGDPEFYEFKQALRRKLADDAEREEHPDPYNSTDQRYYAIRGDSLIIRQSAISTLNVMYLFLDVKEEVQNTDTPGTVDI